GLRPTGKPPRSWRPGGPHPADLKEVQRRADERGLPEVRYPDGWPVESYSLNPIRAAIYAKESGRVVSFTLACFRQIFAAGRDMSGVDNVPIAAAACELPPHARLQGIRMTGVKEGLGRATEDAIELGVTGIPTVAVGDQLFWGDDHLEEAVVAAS